MPARLDTSALRPETVPAALAVDLHSCIRSERDIDPAGARWAWVPLGCLVLTSSHPSKDAPVPQYPVLSTQYSVPSIQYPVLSTQYSVLSTRYSVLGTRYSVLGTQYVPSTRYSVLGTRY